MLCTREHQTFQGLVAWLVRNGWVKRTKTGQRHFATVLTLTARAWALRELEAVVATPVTPTVPTGSVLVKMEQGDYV